MKPFVLLVEFEVQADAVEKFAALIAENARQSVDLEPGCSQFDVCRPDAEATRFVLYEVYDDEAAFEAHKAMPHFSAFFREAKPLIVSQAARRMERAFPR